MINDNKYILLCILLLFLIIIFCYNNEHFTETHFYNLQDSIKIMTNKNYFKHFNQFDFKLRNLKDLENCKKIYSKNTLTYTEKEKNEINNFVKKVRNTKYKKIFDNIKFIKVKDIIESGLPHTRGKAIVFSQKWIDMYNNDLGKNFNMIFIKLISHEQFHVFQRFNADLMETLYKKYWQLYKINDIPKKLKDINRTNPDALPDNFWLFKVNKNLYILPLCIYYGGKKTIRDTRNVYFTLKKINDDFVFNNIDEELENINLLSENKEFRDFFGEETSNNYHPNELSASLFEILVENEIDKTEIQDIPALKELENFLNYEV